MKRRILLIDDDSIVRATIEMMLSGLGYDVISAHDGREGMRRFTAESPDLVITDIIMPEKEGLETIIEMRRQQPTAKILAISGGGRIGTVEVLDLAAQLGADYVLGKPFDREELSGAIARCLSVDG